MEKKLLSIKLLYAFEHIFMRQCFLNSKRVLILLSCKLDRYRQMIKQKLASNPLTIFKARVCTTMCHLFLEYNKENTDIV